MSKVYENGMSGMENKYSSIPGETDKMPVLHRYPQELLTILVEKEGELMQREDKKLKIKERRTICK